MVSIDFNELQFPIVHCTKEQYNNIAIINPNIIYVIDGALSGAPSMYLNNKPIANMANSNGSVVSVNNVQSDETGNVVLMANDIDTYDKVEIDGKINSTLNIQYLDSPINSLLVKSGKENILNESYPIINKNMVIEESDITIKFIVTKTLTTSSNGIYIRTMNKITHEFTDEDTGNTYSTAGNQVGYAIMFCDETYCYFSKTVQSSAPALSPVNFYRLNHTVPGSSMEARANFPSQWRGTSFVKTGNIVYGFGGGSSIDTVHNWDTVWRYNISANTWTVLPNRMPYVALHPNTFLTKDLSRIYITMGYQSNTTAQWSQRHAWYLDIATETIVSMPDRSAASISGILSEIDMGVLSIPTVYRSGNNMTWGELGSQIYVPEINQWINFNTGLPLKTGSSTNATTDSSFINITKISGNSIQLSVDGEPYYLKLDFPVLGLLSKDESAYITAYTKANKDVEDVNGNIITSGTVIDENTEIKILEDNTRLVLLTNITANGSWVRKAPIEYLGMVETLWEGSQIIPCSLESETINQEISLLDDYHLYDQIVFQYYRNRTSDDWTRLASRLACDTSMFVINSTVVLSIIYDYNFSVTAEFHDINKVTFLRSITQNKSNAPADAIKISKIIGIKYKRPIS